MHVLRLLEILIVAKGKNGVTSWSYSFLRFGRKLHGEKFGHLEIPRVDWVLITYHCTKKRFKFVVFVAKQLKIPEK